MITTYILQNKIVPLQKIVSTVKFIHDAPADVSVDFRAQCG